MPNASRRHARAVHREAARPQLPPRAGGTRSWDELAHLARGEKRNPFAIGTTPFAAEGERAQPNREEQQPARTLGLARTAMLAEEAEDSPEVLHIQLAAVGGAADVHDLGVGDEHDAPARLPEAVRPVGLLAEHEEVLVEQAHDVGR